MQLWLETLVETFDLDVDAVNCARALWRLRRIRKTQARLAYERLQRGSYSVVELPAPKHPSVQPWVPGPRQAKLLPAPTPHPATLSEREVYAALPKVDGCTWRVYRGATHVGFHLMLRADRYGLACQGTFPTHGQLDELRLTADAMALDLLAERPRPASSGS